MCLGPLGLSPDSPDIDQIADAGMHGRVSTGQTEQADLLSEAQNCADKLDGFMNCSDMQNMYTDVHSNATTVE